MSTEISDILNNRPLPKQASSSNDFSQTFQQKSFSLKEPKPTFQPTPQYNDLNSFGFQQSQEPIVQKPNIDFDFSSFTSNTNSQPSNTLNTQQSKPVSYNFEPEETTGPKWKKQAKVAEPIPSSFIPEPPKPMESMPSTNGLDFDFLIQGKVGSEASLPKNKVLKLGGAKKLGEGTKPTALNGNSGNKLDAYFGSQPQQNKPSVNFDADFI